MMAVVKMMLAFLGMAAVAYALPPQEEALIAKPAGQNETEVGNIRERRTESHMTEICDYKGINWNSTVPRFLVINEHSHYGMAWRVNGVDYASGQVTGELDWQRMCQTVCEGLVGCGAFEAGSKPNTGNKWCYIFPIDEASCKATGAEMQSNFQISGMHGHYRGTAPAGSAAAFMYMVNTFCEDHTTDILGNWANVGEGGFCNSEMGSYNEKVMIKTAILATYSQSGIWNGSGVMVCEDGDYRATCTFPAICGTGGCYNCAMGNHVCTRGRGYWSPSCPPGQTCHARGCFDDGGSGDLDNPLICASGAHSSFLGLLKPTSNRITSSELYDDEGSYPAANVLLDDDGPCEWSTVRSGMVLRTAAVNFIQIDLEHEHNIDQVQGLDVSTLILWNDPRFNNFESGAADIYVCTTEGSGLAAGDCSKCVGEVSNTHGSFYARACGGLHGRYVRVEFLASKGLNSNVHVCRLRIYGVASSPTDMPSDMPSLNPTTSPTDMPSDMPSLNPTANPSAMPSDMPSLNPTANPTDMPSVMPSLNPTANPTAIPSLNPTSNPTSQPSSQGDGLQGALQMLLEQVSDVKKQNAEVKEQLNEVKEQLNEVKEQNRNITSQLNERNGGPTCFNRRLQPIA